MTPLRKAALRLEAAEGMVLAVTQGKGTLDLDLISNAVESRDMARDLFRAQLRDASGMDPVELTRLLAL